jgi:hypothetical protein
MAALERFFERIFERQTARLFRTKLQPIQLQRRIERAMESARSRDGDRTVVPNRYVVRVSPADLAALREAHPTLAADLADAALAFARSHGYSLIDRPTVTLEADERIEAADAQVSATTDRRHAESGQARAAGSGTTSAQAEAPGDAPSIEHTAVFVVPVLESSRAVLREIRPDGASRTLEIDGRPLTIGRGADNGLVLADSRASRHHARLFGRRGALILADLGSTNGSWVNDRRIDEMALGEGDQIRIGDTLLIVESVEPLDGAEADGPPADGPTPDGAGEVG